MSRLIMFFGPVPSGLFNYVDDERWGPILRELSEKIGQDLKDRWWRNDETQDAARKE